MYPEDPRFVDTVKEAQYAGATDRKVSLPWAPDKTELVHSSHAPTAPRQRPAG
jgi:hypothetical protein